MFVPILYVPYLFPDVFAKALRIQPVCYTKDMLFYLACAAAAGCAISNGIAGVLEKVGADREVPATSLRFVLLWKVAHQLPYLAGIGLDLIGWLLTLFAVRHLPLFLVQSIVAMGVIVTALTERVVLGGTLGRRRITGIGIALGGLLLLGLVAQPETVAHVRGLTYWTIVAGPALLALCSVIALKLRGSMATIALAVLSGIGFGGTSIVGRIITLPHHWWLIVFEPLSWALVAYGLLAILVFTIAVQRGSATAAAAGLICGETIAPTIVGLLLLGDSISAIGVPVVAFGSLLTIVGACAVALGDRPKPMKSTDPII
jgi:drug/metabolite transporter (DMT)-like permease